MPFTANILLATAVGQAYKTHHPACVLGHGYISADGIPSGDIVRRVQRAWSCFRRYSLELYDRPPGRVLTA